MKARRVSWGSVSSSASSEAGSERAAASDSDSSQMEQLSLPEPCCSPRIGGTTHAPGIKGARWVREQRAERTRRHEAEAQTARSSAEEKELQKELGQVLRQSQEIIKELSPTEGAPVHMPLRSPPAQAWAADEASGKRVAFADDAASCSSAESDGSSASGEASSGSACSSSSSSSASSGSGFTLRLRFKLPSHRGGGSARLRVAPGEDPLSAAQRFGRENSLRPHEVDKVRHGIQKQLGRIDRRLRVEPPPPKSTDAANKRSEVAAAAQKPTSTVAEEAPKAQAAEVPVKSVRTWVAMTPEEIAEWRLLQRCKQKASAASSPSLPVSELADSFRVRWAEDSAAAASGAGTGTGAGAAPAQPQLRIPHRASYSPDIRNPAADADSDSESDSDCSSSSESEPEVVAALPEGLRLSVEQQRAQQRRRDDGSKGGDAEDGENAEGRAALALGAPAVRGRSINTGVEGATPKEVKECSLVRTPTKQVKKMGRYKRRTARAQAETALNEKLQRYTAELAAATHRRGRSRHVIDLPAHVVAHIRGKIAECQQQLAEMQPDYNEGTRFRPWFLGDRCRLVRSPRATAGAGAGEFIDAAKFIKSEMAAAVAGAVSGRVEYVGPAPSLGRGVWVGLVLGENEGDHDGTVGGRSYFSCEAGRGVLVRPKALLPIEEEGSAAAAAAADRPRRSE
eukprot:COSAG04_NODE_143_length_23569_cov_6.195356_3_plen_682_part_00